LGRPKGRRLVPPETTKHPPLIPQQRLLLLDTWRRSGLPAGDFAALVGLSKQTLYAWLGLSEPRFHQLRTQILQAGLDSLEPRPAGRPPRPAPDERLQGLEARVTDLTIELQAAEVRDEIALTLPPMHSPAPAPAKKAPRRRPSPRRRRPRNP
jgi:hypothetical protein